MVRPNPVVPEILRRNPLEFDFMSLPVLFSSLCVNNLRLVELRSGGEDVLLHFWRELSDGETLVGGGDESSKHVCDLNKISKIRN